MSIIAGEEFDLTYVRKGKHFEKYLTPEDESFRQRLLKRNLDRDEFSLSHLSIQVQNIRSLEQALDAYRVLDSVDKPLCIDFLRLMLRLKPSDRASAAELLEHAWIKS
jgi:serine/threonine-protein kinase SRPK3